MKKKIKENTDSHDINVMHYPQIAIPVLIVVILILGLFHGLV